MKRRDVRIVAIGVSAILSCPLAPAAQGVEWEIAGSIGVETRLFLEAPEFAGQDDRRVSPSVFASPELTITWNDGADRITVAPFARYDADDSRRTHWDIREANWLHTGTGWDVLIGVGKVFWGVAESRHLVDIINQTDAVEDIDEEDKLGQPMAALTVESDLGTFRGFVLPGFRERTFPADDARLRGPTRISRDPTYDSGAKEKHVDFAARWSHVIGDLDIGLAHFYGTSREPRLPVSLQPDGSLIAVPHYDQINQTSLDAQVTTGDVLWKLEVMTRSGHGKRFVAAVGGLEYTFFNVGDTGADIGLVGEYLYDGRENQDETKAPSTAADDDVFAAVRLTLNDEHDSSLLMGALVDRVNHSTLFSLEASRRIGDYWKAEVEGRLFRNVDGNDVLARTRSDSFLALRLSRFF